MQEQRKVATVVQFKDVGRNKFIAVAVDREVKEYDAMTFVLLWL
jgi:hypothetical protein